MGSLWSGRWAQVYPEAKLFKLERNYRSTRNIVNAANSLIHKNAHQIEKTVYSEFCILNSEIDN